MFVVIGRQGIDRRVSRHIVESGSVCADRCARHDDNGRSGGML
jgi:hypothetical protein